MLEKSAWGYSWWRHQMETFSAFLAFCAGNSPVNSPHKGQWHGALMFSLICTWTNCWINNRDTGDLRRHCAHYDVTLMCYVRSLHRLFGNTSQSFNRIDSSPTHLWDSNYVITVPADALAPSGARTSAGTVLAMKLDMYSPHILNFLIRAQYLSAILMIIIPQWFLYLISYFHVC